MDETGVKLVHDFNEASREMSELLGGKGANLAEMTRVVGADRVPGGFNDHDGGLRRLRGRQAPDGLWEQVEQPRGRIVDSCIPHGTSISSTSPSALSCADCRGELDLPTAVGLATPVGNAVLATCRCAEAELKLTCFASAHNSWADIFVAASSASIAAAIRSATTDGVI